MLSTGVLIGSFEKNSRNLPSIDTDQHYIIAKYEPLVKEMLLIASEIARFTRYFVSPGPASGDSNPSLAHSGCGFGCRSIFRKTVFLHPTSSG